MERFKIRSKFMYDCMIYNGDNEELKSFLKDNGIELLKVEKNEDFDGYYTMYIINQYKAADSFDFENGWYIWIDEIGEVNTANPEYAKENYNIIKSEVNGNIISLRG